MLKLERQIWDMLHPSIEDMGFRLVRIRLTGAPGKNDYTLQIMIEPPTATPANPLSVTVDDCAEVSRMASALMDVADPITVAYKLEVSSTGMERPLVQPEDFISHIGYTAKIELYDPAHSRKRFDGIVKGFDGDDIIFHQTGEAEEWRLPYNSLKSARRTLNDAEYKAIIKAKKQLLTDE